jgi:GTP-binding protein YchF
MADMEMVERRIDKCKKAAKSDKKFLQEAADFEGLRDWLNDGKSARSYEEVDIAAEYPDCELLSLKPVIYAANLDEDGFADPEAVAYYNLVKDRAAKEGAQVIPVCAKLEAEIAELDAEEKAMFLEDLGITESGLDRLVKASYTLLGLISYLTSGEDECRAWTIKKGTKAPQAAGKIHSDFERGFIRAEIVSYEDLMATGSMVAAKEKGLVRSEGKEYVVQDGDIILFRFNV